MHLALHRSRIDRSAAGMSNPEYDYLFKVGVLPYPLAYRGCQVSTCPCRPSRSFACPSSDIANCCPACLQLLLIGDSGVGKSCLLLRFAVSASTAADCGWHNKTVLAVFHSCAFWLMPAGRHLHGELHLHHRCRLCEWGQGFFRRPASYTEFMESLTAAPVQLIYVCRKSGRWSWTAK